MKAILEFNLPEEQEEFDAASHAEIYKSVLGIFANNLRDQLKYDPPRNKKEFDIINNLYTSLFELAERHGIPIW